jgi:hypothetical protein
VSNASSQASEAPFRRTKKWNVIAYAHSTELPVLGAQVQMGAGCGPNLKAGTKDAASDNRSGVLR